MCVCVKKTINSNVEETKDRGSSNEDWRAFLACPKRVSWGRQKLGDSAGIFAFKCNKELRIVGREAFSQLNTFISSKRNAYQIIFTLDLIHIMNFLLIPYRLHCLISNISDNNFQV